MDASLAPTVKTCLGCAETLDIGVFSRNNKGHHARCNPCRAKYNRAKGYTTWMRYGMTEVEYRGLQSTHPECAICGLPPEENRNGVLVIDHCHSSGKVRGLLCNPCNSALGYFEDDPERLVRAAAYLIERG